MSSGVTTLAQILSDATASLRNAETESPQFIAELLLAHVIQQPRSYIKAGPERALTAAQHAQFQRLVERRLRGEPVAYLTGRREFWSLDLEVTSATLIPRAETETLVELALQRIPVDATFHVADLGTGSGAIALAIAHERPRCVVLATDISAHALSVAQSNAQRLEIKNISFRHSAWFAGLRGERFDVIVSNPPYVAEHDIHLQRGDLRFEPQLALSSGADGLCDLHTIVQDAPAHLGAEGWLLVEHGYDQQAAVIDLFSKNDFMEITGYKDTAGVPRGVSGRRPSCAA
ncbi:MAG: peptide chain release factor N(5)-glutamine methyltransferase [Gammaproteobacteria bacterium]|nr:peptide chain release factor N(5)-glutamine methyltransferase [Gammaproteobacteria bacterium]